MPTLKIKKVPSVLERIAAQYSKPHEEVGLDALFAYSYYTREEGIRPTEAYCLTLTGLHAAYKQPPNTYRQESGKK